MQSPEQWLDRQGELFGGFLDANPSYLMMVSCKREEERQFRELVRSERLSAGNRVKRVPNRQLRTTQSAADSSNSEFLELLRPGATLLVTNDQFSDDIPTNHHSPLVLSAVSAIYAPDGVFFGINIIELDLSQRLRELIPSIAPEYVSVIVTDATGKIMMDYRNGRFIDVSGTRLVASEFPDLKTLFTQVDAAPEVGDGRGYFAKIVQLGQSSSRARVGFVAYILK